jgi:hypothetical protein
MQALLLNTETNQAFTLLYLPLELELGGVEVEYVVSDIPRRSGAIATWQGTKQSRGSIPLTIDGADCRSRIQQLQNLCKPIKGKNSPPVCILKIGAMEPITCVMTAVRPTLQLGRFDRTGNPTRASVVIEYLPVSLEAIA